MARRSRRWSAVLVVWSCVATACSDDGLGRAGTFPVATPDESTVTVRATGCRRTSTKSAGVVVAPELVATVAHPVAGEREVVVVLPDDRRLDAQIAAIDTVLDLAVLRVPGLRIPPVATGRPDAGPAELVTAPSGTPDTEPVAVRRVVRVRTSDIYRDGVFDRPGLELADATVDPGDSGGGVFQRGRLVAIVWGTSRLDPGRAWATDVAAYASLVEAASSGEVAAPVSCGR